MTEAQFRDLLAQLRELKVIEKKYLRIRAIILK